MLLYAGGALATDHALVDGVVPIAFNIFYRAVLKVHLYPAAACAHVTGRGFHLVPGFRRCIYDRFGHWALYCDDSRLHYESNWHYDRSRQVIPRDQIICATGSFTSSVRKTRVCRCKFVKPWFRPSLTSNWRAKNPFPQPVKWQSHLACPAIPWFWLIRACWTMASSWPSNALVIMFLKKPGKTQRCPSVPPRQSLMATATRSTGRHASRKTPAPKKTYQSR